MGERVNRLVRKLDAGKPPVQFDERGVETEHLATAPLLDSTHSHWDEAIRFYSVARGLRPDCEFLLKDLGNALRAAGREEEAVHCFKEAIRVKPDFAEARSALRRLLPDEGLLQAPSSQVREQWRREMQRRATALKVSRIERDRPVSVNVAFRHLLAFSSPTQETREGTLWACGGAGRPVVLVAMEFTPLDQGQVGGLYELATLAEKPIQVEGGDGRWRWQQKLPGVSIMQEFGAAPVPAVTAPDRLVQMKGLAKRMTAHSFGGALELPVSPEPIHRYADDAAGIIDGAIFAFAHLGNPEVILLLEAHRRAKASPVWQYGLTRMSASPLLVTIDGNEVWKQKPSDGLNPFEGYQGAWEPYLPP